MATPASGGELEFQRATLVLGFALLGLAGWIDAVGLVRWHELYVAFMSGNTARLGGEPALGHWAAFDTAGRALLMYVAGVVAGEMVAPVAGRWRSPTVVAIEAGLLWLAAAAVLNRWGDGVTIALAGLAMGLQTAAVHKADGVSVALTYVTGTVVNLGRGIAAALRGAAPWAKVLPFAGFWLSLCGGSLGGAWAARTGLGVAMLAAAGYASALAVYAGAVASRSRIDPDG